MVINCKLFEAEIRVRHGFYLLFVVEEPDVLRVPEPSDEPELLVGAVDPELPPEELGLELPELLEPLFVAGVL